MTSSQPLASLPLPVRLFRDAMQRQIPLDAYATALGVAGVELRALLTAQADQIAPETLSRVAAAYEQSPRQALAALAPIVAAEPFNVWLGRQMEGVTQTSLRARTQLAAPLLRAFVSGKALPDADQAERLARALYVDRGEMARIIVADMTRRVAQTRPPGGRQGAEPGAAADQRRSPAASSAATRDAPPPSRARRRRATPEAVDTASSSAGAPAPAPPRPPVSEEAAPVSAVPPPGTPTDDVPTAGRRPRGRKRQSDTLPATAEVATTPPAVADDPAPPPLPAVADDPAPPPPRRHRGRAKVEEGPPAAVAVEAVEEEAQERVPNDQVASPAPARAARRRRAAAEDAPSPALSADDRNSDHPIAEASSSDQLQGEAVRLPPALPPTAADVVSRETTLQLTPDEARLIRLWRRLHPHGRRATLHYIGSLLVEE